MEPPFRNPRSSTPPLSLLPFPLSRPPCSSISSPLLNLFSSPTDTYTCNSQPDPSESFELPATGQINGRNPERRHIFAPLSIVPIPPPACVFCIFYNKSCLPDLKAFQKAAVLMCSETTWSCVGPRWKRIKRLKSRQMHYLIHMMI